MERPQPTWMESREPQDRLANIETFDPLPSDWYRHATGNRDAEAGRHDDNPSLELVRDTGEHLTLAEGPPARIGFDDTDVARVAPRTVVRPTPTTPHAPPARSGTSEDAVADSSDDTLPIDEPARRVAPDQAASVRIESKSYVVQKGETLGEIASKVYGTVKAMSFLVDANRQTVKDKDSIIEGQTLLTPDWPGADQFEPAANPGVPSLARETPQTIVMQDLLNRTTGSAGRSAPTALVPDAPREARRTEPRVAESDPARAYTIQPKDTFCSIAKNTLGSDTLWREIQKVNPDLDPKKLRPGMTIQLPPAQAWNSVVSSE
jgi:nucleoid-associated protein YgaU